MKLFDTKGKLNTSATLENLLLEVVKYGRLDQEYISKMYDELTSIYKKNHKVVCTKCHLINEYAEPNQKDGSYICFNCR